MNSKRINRQIAKLLQKYRWVNSIFIIGLILIWILIVEINGVYPSYLTSTMAICFAGIWLVLNQPIISFQVIVFAIIMLPAFSPFFAWVIFDKELFSLAARFLQYDRLLVDKTVYLYALAAFAYVSTAAQKFGNYVKLSTICSTKYSILYQKILILLGILTVASVYVLESGPTIITANYSEIKAGHWLEQSSFTAFLGVMFGGLWSIMFLFGRHYKKLFWFVTIAALVWLFLHIRRVEVFGVVLVLVLWTRYFVSYKRLLFFFVVFISIQAGIGMVRNFSLYQHFTDNREQSSAISEKAALPGGASNVFLTALHLVNVKDKEMLTKNENFTMKEWPRSIIPNTIWEAFGLNKIQNEHDIVFDRLGLNYVGGMALLGAFYLNGGVALVLIYGLLHGAIGQIVDRYLNTHLKLNLYRGGTVGLLVAFVFIIYQFRYHWYNPQTMFRAVAFTFIIYLVLNLFLKRIRVWFFSNVQSTMEKQGDQPSQGKFYVVLNNTHALDGHNKA
jgi:hypothetical protein